MSTVYFFFAFAGRALAYSSERAIQWVREDYVAFHFAAGHWFEVGRSFQTKECHLVLFREAEEHALLWYRAARVSERF
jgi:hypothetical protein